MRKRARRFWIAAVLLAAGGCDDRSDAPPAPTAPEESDVVGVVTLRGRPLKEGTVVFHHEGGRSANRDRSARLGADGAYSIKAYVGPNTVTIQSKELATSGNRMFQDFEKRVDVQSEGDSIDFAINPQGEEMPRPTVRHRPRR